MSHINVENLVVLVMNTPQRSPFCHEGDGHSERGITVTAIHRAWMRVGGPPWALPGFNSVEPHSEPSSVVIKATPGVQKLPCVRGDSLKATLVAWSSSRDSR